MVVLHGPRLDVQFQGVLGGQVLRVEVVRDHVRVDAEEPAEVHRCLQERLIGGEVLEISDVVAADESRLLCHRHRVLQLGADGEHLPPCRLRQPQRFGRVAAGPPHHLHPAACRLHDRVVATDVDLAVVCQHTVDEGTETGESVIVGVAIGSSERLPLVMTSGRATFDRRRWCSGV